MQGIREKLYRFFVHICLTALFLVLSTSLLSGDNHGEAGHGTPPNSGSTGAHTASDNHQKIYQKNHDLPQSVNRLLLEQGLPLVFASAPYSGRELLQNLRRIDPTALSSQGRDVYDRVLTELRGSAAGERTVPPRLPGTPGTHSGSGEVLSFSSSLELTGEIYQQVREDETMWEYGFERRAPFLRVPLEMWMLDSTYAMLDLSLRRNYDSFADYMTRRLVPETADNNREVIETPEPDPRINIPPRLRDIDPQFPFRSFVAVGGDHWSAQIGRDIVSWGPGRSSTLAVSDYADYHEALRVVAFFDTFKYSYLWINAPRFTEGDLGHLEEYIDVDSLDRPVERNYIGHRLDHRLGNRVNIGLYEIYIIAKESMEFRYLHPVMLYHNHYLPQSNSSIMAGFDFDLALAPGWNVYGEYAFNSLMFHFLHREAVDNDPDAWAALLGVETVAPGQHGHWRLGIEGVYTNPWFAVHRRPQTAFTHSRRIMAEHVDGRRYVTVEKPLGYRAGPDFVGVFLNAGYDEPSRFSVGTTLSVQGKGQRDLYISTFDDFDPEEAPTRSPSGDHPQWRNVVELDVSVHPFEVAGLRNPVPLSREVEIGSNVAASWTQNRRRPGERQSKSPFEFDLQWTGRISFRW